MLAQKSSYSGLLFYLLIGALIACRQILSADKWHKLGILNDEEYIAHKCLKKKVFWYITVFWFPALINSAINGSMR